MRSPRQLVVGLALCWALGPGVAHAQRSPKDEAKGMAERGQNLLQAGRPAEALVELKNAEATFHAPTIVLLIARAHADLGQLEKAYDEYTRVIDEKLDASAPPEWAQAQRLALEERGALGSKLAVLTIVVDGSGLRRLAIDDVSVMPGRAVPLRPGAHVIAWNGPRGERTQNLQAAAGTVQTMAIGLESGAPPQLRNGSPARASSDGDVGWLAGAIAGFSVGLIGMGVGIGTGLHATSLKDELEASGKCRDGVCLGDAQDDVDEIATFAHVSTAAFAAGGVALAAGAALLVVYLAVPGDDRPTVRARAGADGGFLETTWRF